MTNKEIARLLQISPATVSLALNNKPGVSEDTRQKIFELKEASLRDGIENISKKNQGSDIGLVIYKEGQGVIDDTPFFNKLIDSVDRWTRENACRFQIFQVSSDNIDDYIDCINSSQLVGVLILATEMTVKSAEMFRQNLLKPFVLLDGYFPGVRVDSVLMDNIGGITLAVEYGVKMGHKSIGYLKSSIPCHNFYDRYNRFRIESLNYAPKIKMDLLTELLPSIDEACEEMKEFLKGRPKLPTLLIADNDRIAIGAMRALQECGYRIPEDISIIGFDDMPMAQYVSPSLTSIRLRESEIAEIAVERLVKKIIHVEQAGFSVQQFMEVEIIPRDSVKRILP